jgi:hypothetical protein
VLAELLNHLSNHSAVGIVLYTENHNPHCGFNTNKRLPVILLAIALLTSLTINVVQYFRDYPIDLLPHMHGAPAYGDQVLINGNVTLKAKDSYSIAFYLPKNAVQVGVSGSFQVIGNESIKVYIVPQSGSPSYYDSGSSNSGNISASIPTLGVHYLVYKNENQSNNLIVDTNVNLSYYVTV